MGLRTTLANLLTTPLQGVLEARVQELATHAIDRRRLASAADVRQLMDELRRMNTTLDNLDARLYSVREQLEQHPHSDDEPGALDELALRMSGVESRDESLQQRVEAVHRQLESANEAVSALRVQMLEAKTTIMNTLSAVEQAAERAESVQAGVAALATTSAPQDRGCMVDGCTGKHRARGFCGKHYQMYRRGTLPGFVSGEGQLFFEEDGPRWTLAKSYAGKPAQLANGKVRIEGKVVKAKRST